MADDHRKVTAHRGTLQEIGRRLWPLSTSLMCSLSKTPWWTPKDCGRQPSSESETPASGAHGAMVQETSRARVLVMFSRQPSPPCRQPSRPSLVFYSGTMANGHTGGVSIEWGAEQICKRGNYPKNAKKNSQCNTNTTFYDNMMVLFEKGAVWENQHAAALGRKPTPPNAMSAGVQCKRGGGGFLPDCNVDPVCFSLCGAFCAC